MTPDDLVLTRRGVRFQGRHYPCTIGKGGLTADKREGDGATPIGTHAIGGILYRPDRIPPPTPWATPIGPNDLWSDDAAHSAYNHMVRAPYPHSHEALHRADPLYDLVIVTGWNWPNATAGRGSAIFIHQWRRLGYPTEGCVAFTRAHLLHIATCLTPRSRLIVPPLPNGSKTPSES